MTCKAVELAEAIVERLNAGEFSLAFNAERRIAPFVKPEDLATLRVSVFPGTRSSERRTRDGFAHTYKPQVVIQKKLQPADELTRRAEADGLLQLVDEIEADFEGLEGLADLAFAGFDENETDRDTYNIDMLRSMGVFGTLLSLEFQD